MNIQTLFLELAKDKGFLSDIEIETCLKVHTISPPHNPTPRIVNEYKLMTRDELREVITDLHMTLEMECSDVESLFEDWGFANVAFRLGFLKPNICDKAWEEQKIVAKYGVRQSLGEVLLKMDLMDEALNKAVIEEQEERTIRCPFCQCSFSLKEVETPEGGISSCPVCGGGDHLLAGASDMDDFGSTAEEWWSTGHGSDSSFNLDETQGGLENTEKLSNELIGTDLGHFKIKRILGSGAMGTVYLAENKALKREVALKLLPRTTDPTSKLHLRFNREAKSAGMLRHPNIVSVYSVGNIEGHPFLELEYVPGKSLSEVLKENPNGLPEGVALSYTKQMAVALSEAQEAGIIHRDIKPGNILITDEGVAKLADFGLARATDSTLDLTKTGQMLGTPAYVSPEQCKGENVDHRSDLYSLGVTLYHMLCGKQPFVAQGIWEIIEMQINMEPFPITIHVDVSRSTKSILEKMMAKDINQRYQSGTEVSEDIEKVESGGSVFYRIRKLGYWRPWIRLGAAVLLATVGGLGFYLFNQFSGDREKREVELLTRSTLENIENEAWDEAKITLNELMDLEPQNAFALEWQGKIEKLSLRQQLIDQSRIAESEKRWADSISALESAQDQIITPEIAIRIRSHKFQLHKENALADRKNHRFEKAIENLETALLYGNSKQKTLAESLIKEIQFESRGAQFSEQMNAANEAINNRLFKLAREHIGKASALAPNDPLVAEIKTKLQNAEHRADSILSFRNFLGKASDALGKGKEQEALRFLDQANSLVVGDTEFKRYFPNDWKSWVSNRIQTERFSGKKAAKAGKFDQAIKAYSRVLVLESDVKKAQTFKQEISEVFEDYANQLEKNHSYSKAMAQLETALSYSKENIRVTMRIKNRINSLKDRHYEWSLERARRFATEGHFDKADRAFGIALRYRPNDREAKALRLYLHASRNSDKEMVVIAPAKALLGNNAASYKNPVHDVFVLPFRIDLNEVTNEKYAEFLAAKGYSNEKYWDKEGWKLVPTFTDIDGNPGPAWWVNGSYKEGFSNHPVEGISWYEAKAYARFRNKRLPSADEWEIAASWDFDRSKRLTYPWGNSWKNGLGATDQNRLARIGSTKADQSPSGCFDMGGSVQEWTDTPTGNNQAVLKGGCILDIQGTLARCARRFTPPKNFRGRAIGLRLAHDIVIE